MEDDFKRTHSFRRNTMNTYKTESSRLSAYQTYFETNKYFNYIKLFYFCVSLFNSILGVYIIYSFYEKLYQNMFGIYFYIILYTFNWLIAAIITLILFLLIKVFVLKAKEETETNEILRKDTFDEESESKKQNHIQLCYIIFIINLVLLYFVCVIYSVVLFFDKSIYQQFYKEMYEHIAVFIFLSVNSIKAIAVLIIFIKFILRDRRQIIREQIELDDDFIKQIEHEVMQANKVSGLITANKDLIKLNNMFNRQYMDKDLKNSVIIERSEDGSPSIVNKVLSEASNSPTKRLSLNRLTQIKDEIDLQSNNSSIQEKRNSRIKDIVRKKTFTTPNSDKKQIIETLKSKFTTSNNPFEKKTSDPNLTQHRNSYNNFPKKEIDFSFRDSEEEDKDNHPQTEQNANDFYFN